MRPEFAYVFALAAATVFASASLVFTEISRRVTPLWMNAVKALGAFVLFGASVLLFGSWETLPAKVVWALVTSGLLGLGIGDIFLLYAYTRMGAARTLILFGFQPLFVGIGAKIFFDQEINLVKLIAVIFFLACLFTFSLEKFKEHGHWEVKGLIAALVGVLFDNSGVLLSRWAFDTVPAMDAFQANWWRCLGAVAFFVVLGAMGKVQWRAGWKSLSPRARRMTLASIFMGTFLSLFFYLTAIKIGHLASISALGVSGPLISSTLECAYYRKRPTRYLLVALVFFIIGFGILTLI